MKAASSFTNVPLDLVLHGCKRHYLFSQEWRVVCEMPPSSVTVRYRYCFTVNTVVTGGGTRTYRKRYRTV